MRVGELLDSFSGLRATVLGDLMLDEYIFGHVNRISPEAPVMVVRQERTSAVPGGAANVAKNIVALGGRVRVIGVVGADDAGVALDKALRALPGTQANVFKDAGRVTTRKTRVVADHSHQVLRIDNESNEPVVRSIADQLVDATLSALKESDVLVLSDYLKGILTPAVCEAVVAGARSRNVPVVVNPKPKSVRQYKGSHLVTLNRSEASEVVGTQVSDRDSAKEAAEAARKEIGTDAVVITLGEAGLVSASADSRFEAVPPRVEVNDPAGAGDTVIAVLALGAARGEVDQTALQLAAEASARVVRHVGVAVPSEQDLAEIRVL
jgi:D-beta-D-heptose 7-phosphate kinase/D-beta-D-heptose 1-phosphate adenosyltransferase